MQNTSVIVFIKMIYLKSFIVDTIRKKSTVDRPTSLEKSTVCSNSIRIICAYTAEVLSFNRHLTNSAHPFEVSPGTNLNEAVCYNSYDEGAVCRQVQDLCSLRAARQQTLVKYR